VDKYFQILEKIKDSVRSSDPNAKLILFGSYARGDNRVDSDIDILVLIDKDRVSFEDRKRISYPLYHIEREAGIVISPMIFSKKLWETKHTITPFYKNVTLEGKVL
jgi:uncharacterized protein